ncbi:hypothetical protein ABN763_03335 [Spongiivirga sp. MCCC 1A20706]|uniref:terminase gpP N-terminus-related DNA-binding protein n=1 Tax=Spongiivirga sp. MCCC 1A20706 TaxID=3160963 RepID=UPI003977B2E1
MKPKSAVITADIIDSSTYDPQSYEFIIGQLKAEARLIQEDFKEAEVHFEIYRGDSFQLVINDAHKALQAAIRIKAAINKIVLISKKSKSASKMVDIRMSIGIGAIDYEADLVRESNGPAFHYSGRGFDTFIKNSNIKTLVNTENNNVNNEFKTSLKFFDYLVDRWSIASAEVVYYLLQGFTETKIADMLGISQAAVNLRKKAAGWDEIQSLLNRYEQVIKAI